MSTEIDPQLPYIQVHRSVAAMAAQVAPLLDITYQHARGGFDVLWESLADRRILAKAAALPEPMIALDDKECRLRLSIAFGKAVEPAVFVPTGALEPLTDGRWRVRGMSRYIETERARLKAFADSVAGGRARAAAKRDESGKFVTPPSAGPTAGEHLDGTWTAPGGGAGEHLAAEPAPVQPVTSQEVRGERREVRGEREKTKGDTEAPAEKFWAWAQDLRHRAGLARDAPPHPRTLGVWFSEAMLELNGDDARLQEAFLAFGDDEYWQQRKCPFSAFMSPRVWRKYVPRTQ